jgi:hypothetical protein
MGSLSQRKPHCRRVRTRRIASILLLLALCFLRPPMEAADEAPEYQVKGAFLLNFTKFMEWPAGAFADEHAPLAICILGEDPFGNLLDQLVAGEVVGGRALMVRRIKRPPSPKTCQMVFAARPDKEVAKLLTTLGPGVLTVSEGDGFVREGGMIGFVIESRRVRFGINQTAAENAGFKLSSKLLNVAKSVEK